MQKIVDLIIPDKVIIGKPNKKSKKADDCKTLTKAGGLIKINCIKTYYNDKHIIGFTIYYKLEDGDFLKASHNVPESKSERKKCTRSVLEIGPDDYLLEISGFFTDQIDNIIFTTYRGKIGVYGAS